MTATLKELDEVLAEMNPQGAHNFKEASESAYWFLRDHAPRIRAALELKSRMDADWVLVPREPTPEMVSEAIYNTNRKYNTNPVDEIIVRQVWSTMMWSRPKEYVCVPWPASNAAPPAKENKMTHIEVLKEMRMCRARWGEDQQAAALTAAIAALEAVGNAERGLRWENGAGFTVYPEHVAGIGMNARRVLIIPADAVDAVGGG